MIVVDTNTIAYLYLPTDQTANVEAVLARDPHWVAPLLWRSEFRNILSLYLRKGIIDLETAFQIQSHAEKQLEGNEFSVHSATVLSLANASGCSAYDCEFISIAQSLRLKLVTADKKLLAAFPGVAISAKEFLASV